MEHDKISDERVAAIINIALKDVFGREKMDAKDMFIVVQRIPLICKDVLQIKDDLSKIESNLNKGVWLVLGAVILALIGLVLK